jgi:hypothetical protein
MQIYHDNVTTSTCLELRPAMYYQIIDCACVDQSTVSAYTICLLKRTYVQLTAAANLFKRFERASVAAKEAKSRVLQTLRTYERQVA